MSDDYTIALVRYRDDGTPVLAPFTTGDECITTFRVEPAVWDRYEAAETELQAALAGLGVPMQAKSSVRPEVTAEPDEDGAAITDCEGDAWVRVAADRWRYEDEYQGPLFYGWSDLVAVYGPLRATSPGD